MFTYAADDLECVAVSIWSGQQADVDYEQSIALLERIDRGAAESGRTLVHIAVIEAGYPPPPAGWRKRISEVNRNMVTPQYYFALVTQNAIMRGVFTAVRWLIGARAGHHAVAVASFSEAVAWVRRSTGTDYPQLELLHAQVREAIRAGSSPVPVRRSG